MATSSVDPLESKVHARFVQLEPNCATGAWFGGVLPIVTCFEVLFDNPPASVTVSVTVYTPADVQVFRAVAVVFVSVRPLPQFHRYDTIPLSSVDADASNVHCSVGHDQVKLATGGLFGVGAPPPMKLVLSRRFGDPLPGFVTLPASAPPRSAEATAAGAALGLSWR